MNKILSILHLVVLFVAEFVVKLSTFQCSAKKLVYEENSVSINIYLLCINWNIS